MKRDEPGRGAVLGADDLFGLCLRRWYRCHVDLSAFEPHQKVGEDSSCAPWQGTGNAWDAAVFGLGGQNSTRAPC